MTQKIFKSTEKNESYHPDIDWRCGLIKKHVKNLGKILEKYWNSAKPRTYIIYPAEDSFHAKLEGSN